VSQVEVVKLSGEERSRLTSLQIEYDESVLLSKKIGDVKANDFSVGLAGRQLSNPGGDTYGGPRRKPKEKYMKEKWMWNEELGWNGPNPESRAGFYYMFHWDVRNREEYVQLCEEKMEEYAMKEDENGKKMFNKFARYKSQLLGNNTLDLPCCREFGIGETDSSTMNQSIIAVHSELKKIAAAVVEAAHKMKPDLYAEEVDDEGSKIYVDHVDKWVLHLGVVGKEAGDACQELHVDMEAPMNHPNFLSTMRGDVVPPEESYRYGWAIHVPICPQGVRIRIVVPHKDTKTWRIRYVEIPFGGMALFRMCLWHGGFYSGRGRKTLHGVMLPVEDIGELAKLQYVKDVLFGGIVEELDESHPAYDSTVEDGQYIVTDISDPFTPAGKNKKTKKDRKTVRELFKDWTFQWDERCPSAPPNVTHLASNSEEDSMGTLEEWEGWKEMENSLCRNNLMCEKLLQRISMTEEEYKADRQERGLKWAHGG